MPDGETKAELVHEEDTLIVLIAPAVAGGAIEALRATLSSGPKRVRVLVSLTEKPDAALCDMLARAGRPVEWLLAPGLDVPRLGSNRLSMPPSSDSAEQAGDGVCFV